MIENNVVDYGPIWIALIVAVPTVLTSFVAPIMLSVISSKQARADRQEDYARQDKVAAKAEEAARRLVASNTEVAATAKTVASKLNNKLDVIHGLVNSSMTAAMQSELDAVTSNVVLLEQIIELKKSAGQAPTEDALKTVALMQDKMNELKANLTDRLLATAKTNAIKESPNDQA